MACSMTALTVSLSKNTDLIMLVGKYESMLDLEVLFEQQFSDIILIQ